MRTGGDPVALLVSPTGALACCVGIDPSIAADGVAGLPGLAELLDRAASGPTSGEVTLPDAGIVEVSARPLRSSRAGETWLLVTEAQQRAIDVPAELDRARELLEQAEEAITRRDAELDRLRRLSERLLEHAPVAAVLDDRRRIRGWSSRAEQIWAVPTDRAMGRPAASVLAGLDHRSHHQRQRVEAPAGRIEVVVEPVGDDGDHLLVRLPDRPLTATAAPQAPAE
jgi:hypothetical protein